jgi:hypothetical protein
MYRIYFILGMLFLSGCATDQLAKKLSWSKSEKITSSKYDQPTRMVVLWSPTVLTQPGKPDKSQAIPVEGQLVVYAYNDTRLASLGQTTANGGSTQPDRKFAFTPEQFANHFSPTELGASYSVWIPWDALGGPQIELSLVPVFTTPNGQIVMGQSSRSLLKGNPNSPDVPVAASNPPINTNTSANSVQQVGYNAPNHSSNNVQTTTIALTPSLVKNLRENEFVPFTNTNTIAPESKPLETNEITQPVVSSSSAANQPWSPPDPRSNHFVRPRHPVLTSPRPQPSASPAPWERDLRGSPSGPASIPESAQTLPLPEGAVSAFPTANQ